MAKKKISAKKTSKKKVSGPKKCAKTTIDSSAALKLDIDHGKTTMPSADHNLSKPKARAAAIAKKIRSTDHSYDQNHHRDRRIVSKSRRNRYAEKSPPGTRTKMLKIIYDNKAELMERRRRNLIIKIALFGVLSIGCYYGAQHLWTLARGTTNAITETVNLDSWWENASKRSPQYQQNKRKSDQIGKKRGRSSKRPTYRRNSRVVSKARTQSRAGKKRLQRTSKRSPKSKYSQRRRRPVKASTK